VPNATTASAVTASSDVAVSQGDNHKPVASLSGRDVIKGLTAPAPISQGFVKPPEEEQDSGSLDMFDQGEFVAESSIPKAEKTATSFIPPKPMEADVSIPENGIGSHISSFHGAHVNEKSTAQPTGLSLNPPRKVSSPGYSCLFTSSGKLI